MPVSTEQQYNLPGFGFVRIRLFPHANMVYDFLEGYGHITQLKTMDQLGAIRRVLPGAHHTRYEYLMAQLALITELCHLKGHLPAGISLSTKRNTFGRLNGFTSDPSNGEILMVLALLGNLGHVPSTFAGERALMKYLKDYRLARQAFRNGLPKLDRKEFDASLQKNSVFQFNYYICLFLLERYRRRKHGSIVVDFCQSILRSYIHTKHGNQDQSLASLWSLYRRIRRLTYMALDSHYAPVPFSLDLASIFFSLDHFLGDVFVEESSFQDALTRLEGVMRDTVYMGSEQLLNHSAVGDHLLLGLERHSRQLHTIGDFWNILAPDRQVNEFFSTPTNREGPTYGQTVQLEYDVDPALSPILLPDPIEWERNSRKAVGLRSCRFAAGFDPPQTHLKLSAALAADLAARTNQKAALRSAKQLLDLEARIESLGMLTSASKRTRNGLALLRFLLTALVGERWNYRLRTMPTVHSSPIVRCYGSTRAANHVSDYRKWAAESGLINEDSIKEIEILQKALEDIDYKGSIIAFSGSTEIIGQGRIVAEFDGLAVLLSRNISEPVLLVAEAKNKPNGQTEAARQLGERLPDLGFLAEAFTIKTLGTKGAYARVTVGVGAGEQ